jgi:Protein of unknown function (DUF1479)
MASTARLGRLSTGFRRSINSWTPLRAASTATTPAKKEGDISSAFVSLSGQAAKPLDPRFIGLKQTLIAGREEAVRASFHRLLRVLRKEVAEVKEQGNALIPEISYADLHNPSEAFLKAHQRCGTAVVRGAVPEKEALQYLDSIQAYYRANPSTKTFPANNPAVYELYWSHAQLRARAHKDLVNTHKFLLSQWHTSNPTALLSPSHPISYADRLRIRPPGDAAFALGPHVDGGSCERWEDRGYGRGGVYDAIFAGNWEAHDPFDGAARLPVVSDLYNGGGACSAFRMYQGWLSMSHTGPGEGTLLVNPLFKQATAYYLLRPFFAPRNPDPTSPRFLESDNWDFEDAPSSALQGAYPGHGQELNSSLHPHLELQQTMVHIPQVRPGDYIAWHCDVIHAVDAKHEGSHHSSVLYIPACPLTEANARFLVRQRDTFLKGMCCLVSWKAWTNVDTGIPSPDFPGGKGESEHIGRAGPEMFTDQSELCFEGQRAMGMRAWDLETAHNEQERCMLRAANEILGF